MAGRRQVVLHVAEKPSVARAIAAALAPGPPVQRQGGGRGAGRGDKWKPPVLVFEANVGRLGACEHVVTSVAGHLMNMEFEDPYRSWSKCNPVELFTAPIVFEVHPDNKAIEQQLQAEATRAQMLVLWLDCDREGEGIAFEVIETCKRANARLSVKRARFSGVTPKEILHAVGALVEPDRRMSEAVLARGELDLRLGSAFTRLQTTSLACRFNELHDKLLSYGPCQFPTLGFVVERYLAIAAFVSEPFWEIHMKYRPPAAADRHGRAGAGHPDDDASGGGEEEEEEEEEEDFAPAAAAARRASITVKGRARFSTGGRGSVRRGGDGHGGEGGPRGAGAAGGPAGTERDVVSFTWERGRLYDHFAAAVLHEAVVDARHATVLSVTGAESQRWKPIPLNSVDFAKFASRFLRMSSQAAAKAAEELYQKGFLSYPRTETQVFDDAIDTRALVADHAAHPVWGAYVQDLLTNNKYERPRAGPMHDKAHPPIHPLRAATRADIPEYEHWRVYDFITRHFLACCSKNAVGRTTSVTADMGGERFHASGLVVLERNFLDVYPFIRWNASALPNFQVGQTFVPTSVKLHEGNTQPPAPLAEHELIELMNANGIGTDATIPEHISKVQEREYMVRGPDGRFLPTTLGIGLLQGYNHLNLEAMSKPYLRAAVESDLTRICEGRATREEVVATCLRAMLPVFEQTAKNLRVLMTALNDLFHPIGQGAANVPGAAALSTCGVCRGKLSVKRVAEGADKGAAAGALLSLFCDTCRSGFPLPRGTKGVAPVEHTCPLCGFQVVSATVAMPGAEDRALTLCPKCFSEPPAAMHAQAVRVDTGADGAAHAVPLAAGVKMLCNACTNKGCSLARGATAAAARATPAARAARAVALCGLPKCTGFLQLRQGRNGFYFLACDAPPPASKKRTKPTPGAKYQPGCEHVIWLPKSAKAVAVAPAAERDAVCPHCSSVSNFCPVRRLDFSFPPGSVPPMLTGQVNYTDAGGVQFNSRLCIMCEAEGLDGVQEKPQRVDPAARLAEARKMRATLQQLHEEQVAEGVVPGMQRVVLPAAAARQHSGMSVATGMDDAFLLDDIEELGVLLDADDTVTGAVVTRQLSRSSAGAGAGAARAATPSDAGSTRSATPVLRVLGGTPLPDDGSGPLGGHFLQPTAGVAGMKRQKSGVPALPRAGSGLSIISSSSVSAKQVGNSSNTTRPVPRSASIISLHDESPNPVNPGVRAPPHALGAQRDAPGGSATQAPGARPHQGTLDSFFGSSVHALPEAASTGGHPQPYAGALLPAAGSSSASGTARSAAAVPAQPAFRARGSVAAPPVAPPAAQGALCVVHGVPTVMRVAGPHSKEPGSKFLVCPMRQPGSADDCGTFVWLGADEQGAEEVGDAGGYVAPLRGAGGYAAAHGGAPSSNAASAAVVCYLCHQPGHYANACPRARAMPSLDQATPKQATRGRSASSGRVAGGSRLSADKSPASARHDRFASSKRLRKTSTGSRSHSKGSSAGKRSGVKVPKIGFVTAAEDEHAYDDAHSTPGGEDDNDAWAAVKPEPHAHRVYAPPPSMPSISRTPIRAAGVADAGAGAGAGSNAPATSPSTSVVRKCSVCKKTGHTKAKCPLNLDRLAGFADL